MKMSLMHVFVFVCMKIHEDNTLKCLLCMYLYLYAWKHTKITHENVSYAFICISIYENTLRLHMKMSLMHVFAFLCMKMH
jgi:hypothetical protein